MELASSWKLCYFLGLYFLGSHVCGHGVYTDVLFELCLDGVWLPGPQAMVQGSTKDYMMRGECPLSERWLLARHSYIRPQAGGQEHDKTHIAAMCFTLTSTFTGKGQRKKHLKESIMKVA